MLKYKPIAGAYKLLTDRCQAMLFGGKTLPILFHCFEKLKHGEPAIELANKCSGKY